MIQEVLRGSEYPHVGQTYSEDRVCANPTFLHRQVELLALDDPVRALAMPFPNLGTAGCALGVVDPEKVRVKDRLHDSCDDGDGIPVARHLEEISVDPIGNVESAVCAERKEIVGCDCFRFAGPL
jgi:hypothetical protein